MFKLSSPKQSEMQKQEKHTLKNLQFFKKSNKISQSGKQSLNSDINMKGDIDRNGRK